MVLLDVLDLGIEDRGIKCSRDSSPGVQIMRYENKIKEDKLGGVFENTVC